MLQLAGAPDRLIVSRLGHLEVASAIVRRGRESMEASQKVDSALAALDGDIGKVFHVMEFSEPVISQATDLIRAHGLRTADAVQLACALLSRPDSPASADFCLISADEELNAAAKAEGLAVENPNFHP
jgi:uncharacterized protein